MNLAKEFLRLMELWQQIDSDTLIGNVLDLLHKDGYDTFKEKWNKLSEITKSGKQTSYAWINSSRKNVKIPFIKLCMVASEYNVDLETLMIGGNNYDKPDNDQQNNSES